LVHLPVPDFRLEQSSVHAWTGETPLASCTFLGMLWIVGWRRRLSCCPLLRWRGKRAGSKSCWTQAGTGTGGSRLWLSFASQGSVLKLLSIYKRNTGFLHRDIHLSRDISTHSQLSFSPQKLYLSRRKITKKQKITVEVRVTRQHT